MSGARTRTGMGRYRAYPEYKESGVEWLGEVPGHWGVKRLKHAAAVTFSNVDKKSYDEQLPVRLCNYIDVYHNEHIHYELDFMKATASQKEIESFSLKAGDVIVTKDSETWDDIAVPAYVREDLDGVVCGYHLALIRPYSSQDLVGEYLFRTLSARGICDQLWVSANGITRYGLGKSALGEALLPIPEESEQRAIAAFLDRETAKIDALIQKKQRLIELLQEKRTALITHAVTKGLDPDAPMKESGVEWLGEIPEHWEVKKLSWITACLDGKRIPLNAEERGRMQGDYPYWGANSIVDHVDNWLFDEELVLLGEDGAPFFDRFKPVAFHVSGKIWVNNHTHVLRTLGDASARFLAQALNCVDFSHFIAGSTRDKLTQGAMNQIPVQLPPRREQSAIVAFMDQETTKIDALISKITDAIHHLQEYRTALISAAVTGKIDVRTESEAEKAA